MKQTLPYVVLFIDEYADLIIPGFGINTCSMPANLTGASIGMKTVATRNFECGILSDDETIPSPAIDQFDTIWMEVKYKGCGRRKYCPTPIM